MQSNVSKWGNSLAVRLPAHIAEASRLSEGATVNMEVKDGSLILTPTRKKFKLSELLKGVPARTSGEEDWGKPKGEEEW